MMATKSYLFHDILKTPGYLSQFDVARLRKLANEATAQDFQENFSCDTENAKRILFFWEIAQIELWDADILQNFFHVWIYENRDLVMQRIQAAQIAGRLPERFTPEVGLQWLESENVLIGMIPKWIRANARVRIDKVLNPADAAPVASDTRPDPERRLALLRQLGGTAKYARYEWTFTGIGKLVASEKDNGRKRSAEKTIRADLKEAAQDERDKTRAGFSDGLGQR